MRLAWRSRRKKRWAATRAPAEYRHTRSLREGPGGRGSMLPAPLSGGLSAKARWQPSAHGRNRTPASMKPYWTYKPVACTRWYSVRMVEPVSQPRCCFFIKMANSQPPQKGGGHVPLIAIRRTWDFSGRPASGVFPFCGNSLDRQGFPLPGCRYIGGS